ncbi:hypothetical protein [Rothia dentocariosa]|nr:hypothetical protein [Rothia dentocariosa]
MLMPATPHRHLALYLAVEDESARSAPCTDASRAEKVKVTLYSGERYGLHALTSA